MEPVQIAGAAAKQGPAIFRFLKALWDAPENIRKLQREVARLDAATASSGDPRPLCLACGVGRIELQEYIRPEDRLNERGVPANARHYGTCQKCAVIWYLDGKNLPIGRFG